MSAQARLNICRLDTGEIDSYQLVASCGSCAMCLGAAWSTGFRRVVYGTTAEEVRCIGLGMGPGLGELREFFKQSGFKIFARVRSEKALEVFELFQQHDEPSP